MKINHVHITNHKEPGDRWWEGVASKPDEPLIEATMRLTLSPREYHRLLDMDERNTSPALPSCFVFDDEEIVRIAEARGWKKYPAEREGIGPSWMHDDYDTIVLSPNGFREILS